MATVTLRNLGGSVVMAIPKKVLKLVDLDAGSKAEVTVENGRLIIEPKNPPRYTLTELLSRCRPSDLVPKRRDRVWLQSKAVGKELL